jgi:hypothetical protein
LLARAGSHRRCTELNENLECPKNFSRVDRGNTFTPVLSHSQLPSPMARMAELTAFSIVCSLVVYDELAVAAPSVGWVIGVLPKNPSFWLAVVPI